jgi:hypothetical protein
MTEICKGNHTKYQPGDYWFCPKCGSDNKYFFIEESDPSADDECELMHRGEYIICKKCGLEGSGEKIAAMMAKKKKVIVEKCPHCNGSGYISKPANPPG